MSETEQKYTIPKPVLIPYVNQETITLLKAIAGLHERIEALGKEVK